MALSDFHFRIKVEKSNPQEIIPIYFDLLEILQEKYYIQTRSGAHKESITVGKIYGHDKSLIPYLKPEKAAEIMFSVSK